MPVPVRIPTPLRKLTQNQEIVQIEGATIRDVMNVFVNDEDIRFLQEAETAVKPGDEVSIVPAIAGG